MQQRKIFIDSLRNMVLLNMLNSVKTSCLHIQSLIHRMTQLSKGTGFIKFKEQQDADRLLLKYQAITDAAHQVSCFFTRFILLDFKEKTTER